MTEKQAITAIRERLGWKRINEVDTHLTHARTALLSAGIDKSVIRLLREQLASMRLFISDEYERALAATDSEATDAV